MSTITQQDVAVPTGTFTVDPVHSSLGFEVRYMGIAFFKAAVKDFGASLADGRLSGAARIESLETKDENLHAHLLAPDFFDAEQRQTAPRGARPAAKTSGGSPLSRSRALSSASASGHSGCWAADRARSPIRTATRATGSS